MYVIHKQQLNTLLVRPELELPCGAKILHVGLDPMFVPCVWYGFDNAVKKTQTVKLWVIATGQDMPSSINWSDHLATLVLAEEGLVWHIFQ